MGPDVGGGLRVEGVENVVRQTRGTHFPGREKTRCPRATGERALSICGPGGVQPARHMVGKAERGQILKTLVVLLKSVVSL